jgi:diguanylate cyclase (GGDEF)-like protein
VEKNRETLISFSIFVLFMSGVSLFSVLSYNAEKTMLYQQLNARLYATAKGQTLLLADDFHDRSLTTSAITPAEDIANIDRLSRFAKASGMTYVYTLIEKEGKVYFTASSATDEERKTGENMTRYFDEYDDVSPSIHTAIKEQKLIFDETPDKWGTYRSIIVPMTTPRGHHYAVGADLPISAIQSMLNTQALQHFAFAFLLITVSFTTLLWRLNRIKRLALYDSLTGLPNRMELANHFDYVLIDAQRNNEMFALFFLDLDHFKEINDTLGHKIGDELLIRASKRIRSTLRKVDTASRMGGDEFVLLLPSTDAIGAANIAQKLLDEISKPFHVQDNELTITASIGIALYPIDGRDHETLSKNADTAMYSAKKEGRHGYQFFTTKLQECGQRHMHVLRELHHALERNELEIHYQPQISLHDGHIIGAEALLRWNHPELGSISPVEFIAIAEESGLILPIGEWILRTAIREAKRWQEIGLRNMLIAINVSAVQFRHANFPDLVSDILEETQFSAQYLEIELTEGVAMHNPHDAANIIRSLYERGIKIAIDDFGTGYSSLSYLKKFNVSKLKIDKSFVDDITTDPDDKAIVGAIINMAHGLGLKVIAEGVESHEQLQQLSAQECDEVQGYYYSKPLNAVDFELFAQSHTKAIQFQADAMHHA